MATQTIINGVSKSSVADILCRASSIAALSLSTFTKKLDQNGDDNVDAITDSIDALGSHG